MRISVVVPSYNSIETIRACLSAVMRQTMSAYEVIVVDSSDDSTPDVIRAEFPQARLVHLDRRTLPGAARNIGVEGTNAELVAFTDADCEPDPDWLERLHEGFTDTVVGCAGVIAGPPNETMPAFAYRAMCFSEFMPGARPRLVRAAPVGNLMLRRDAVLGIGGFPDDIFGGEDLLLCRRLTENGQMIRICPQARVVHHSPEDLETVLRAQYRYGAAFSRSREADRTAAGSALMRVPFGISLAAAIRYLRIMGRLAFRDEVSLRRCIQIQPHLLKGMRQWGRGAASGR